MPVVAILGIGAGAIGGAFAIDHFAAKYLWPEPENLAVIHATPEPAVQQYADPEFTEDVVPVE
ncbi:MAG: hypothetical protein AAGA25_12775 [Planctomycetota bacterium]